MTTIDYLKKKYPLVYLAGLKNSNLKTYDKNSKTVYDWFSWNVSEEKENFWNDINNGDFEAAQKRFPHLFLEEIITILYPI